MTAARPLCPPRPLKLPAGFTLAAPCSGGWWTCPACGGLALVVHRSLLYGHSCADGSEPEEPPPTWFGRNAMTIGFAVLGLVVFAAWWVTVAVR